MNGQLGDGTTTGKFTPIQVLTSVQSIAAGYYHSLFVKTDQSLWASGANFAGQLGDGTTAGKTTPVQISSGVQSAAGGNAFSLFVKTNGTFWAMGDNGSGQLGIGGTVNQSTPVQVFAPLPSLKVTIGPDTPIGNSFPAGTVFGFGTTPPGTTDELTLYIRNAGGGALTGVTVSLLQEVPDQYSISTPPASSIPAGGQGSPFVIRFAPTSVGVKSAQITVTSNDPSANPILFYVQSLADTKPTFSGYSASTTTGVPITLSFAKLRAKSYDADGDPLTFQNVTPQSVEGGTVSTQASGILYTPPAGFVGTDSFEIFVQDPHYALGGVVRGTITITVNAATTTGGGAGTNPPVMTMLPGGKVALAFQGIPGRTYLVQRTTDMSTWTTLATLVAGSTGAISFTDESPPPGSAFYRIAKP